MKKEFTGKNVQEAIKNALEELNLNQEDLDIKILAEGGLFTKARIEVTYREEEAEATKEEVATVEEVEVKEEKEEKTEQKESKDIYELTAEFVLNVAKTLDENASVKVERGEFSDYIKLQIENGGRLIGYNGEGLESFQDLVNVFVRNNTKEKKKIFLDINDYKKEKDEKLIEYAVKIADKVEALGIKRNLEPMNSYDRHLIHEALANRKGVKTYSEGEGKERHIIISSLESLEEAKEEIE